MVMDLLCWSVPLQNTYRFQFVWSFIFQVETGNDLASSYIYYEYSFPNEEEKKQTRITLSAIYWSIILRVHFAQYNCFHIFICSLYAGGHNKLLSNAAPTQISRTWGFFIFTMVTKELKHGLWRWLLLTQTSYTILISKCRNVKYRQK